MIRVLSFGAGVQSTALARMSLDGAFGLPLVDAMIFADPGAELPETIENAAEIQAACHNRGVDFIRVTNTRSRSTGNIFTDLMQPNPTARWAAPPLFIRDEHGDGFTNRQCTGDFKVDPIMKALRAMAGIGRRRKFPDGPVVEQWLGISADEAQRQKTSRWPWLVMRHPLVDLKLNRAACEEWLKTNGYRVPVKSACFFCPYQSRARWRDMKINRPPLFERACVLDEHLRANRESMGLRGTPYLLADRVPLRDADLLTNTERARRADHDDLFDDECSGVCGV